MGAIKDAVDADDTEKMLSAMIDALATELDNGVPARELASVTKRLMELHKERQTLREAKKQAEAEAVGTAEEKW